MVDTEDERIRKAVECTEILRAPRQSLYTFGTTNIYYYLVTEPAYSELIDTETETVVREGRVLAERPKIVTPYYLTGLEGFSTDAGRYFESLIHEYGPNAPGLLYAYRNEPKELNIVSGHWQSVVEKINADISLSLSKAILQLLQKNPDDRPSTASKVKTIFKSYFIIVLK